MSKIDEINTGATSKIDTAKGKVDKALSSVDMLISIFDNEKDLFGKDDILAVGGFDADVQISPFALIMEILKRTGHEDDVVEFITTIVTSTLPYIETGVKAAILANVKGMISCASDPFIPKNLRKLDDDTNSDERGIFLNIEGIDFNGMLKKSPLSKDGGKYYFGIHDGASVYESARALDFNAFLWYCIHKSETPQATVLDEGELSSAVESVNMTLRTDNPFDFGGEPGTRIDQMVVLEANDETGGFIPGSVLSQRGNPQKSLCIKSGMVDGKLNNMFVPIGTFRNGCNWYIPNGNLMFGDWTESYNDEHPICNVEYVDKQNSGSATNNAENRFKFTILPKPYTAYTSLLKGTPILMSPDGRLDKDGSYTIKAEKTDYYEVEDAEGNVERYIELDGNRIHIDDDGEVIGMSNGGETITNFPAKYLTECYKGLTVYEFNYDFVMGMRLFDSKVVTTRLIEMLTGIGVGASVDFNASIIDERIVEIIRSVIEADDYASSDCYFNFSNERYDAMMAEAEMRRYLRKSSKGKTNVVRDMDTESIYDILSDYKEESTLEEKTAVVKRAITEANAMMTGPQKGYDFSVGGFASYDGKEIGWDVLSNMVENIAIILCESVVTPKMVMLLEINRKLMRTNDEPLTVESFMRMAVGMIVAIVKQIRDRILEELLKWVELELAELIGRFAQALVKEQAMCYIELLRNLKETCGALVFGSESASKITNVNYADIDNNAEELTAQCD